MLAEYVGPSDYANQGERVVAGQHLMNRERHLPRLAPRPPHREDHEDYYVRQLRDWKCPP